MKNWYRLLGVLLLLACGSGVALAQSSPPPNPNYTQYNTKADGDIPTPPAGKVRFFYNGTNFRFKTSAGAFTDVGGAGITGLTAGKLTVATAADAIANSKWTMTGGSLGTATLYDDGATGISGFNIRAGVNQSTNALQNWRSAADAVLASVTSSGGVTATGASTITINSASEIGLVVTQSAGWNPTGGTGDGNFALRVVGYSDLGGFRANAADGDNSLYSATAFGISTGGATIKFGAPSAATFRINTSDGSIALGSAGANFDIGAVRSALGILKVTDGSTGFGSVTAAAYGANTGSSAAASFYFNGDPNTGMYSDSADRLFLSAGGTTAFLSATAFRSPTIFQIGATDITLTRVVSGIVQLSDGAGGQAGFGAVDAATNTVTDALILRHATSGTAAASFGTGLLFQGENAAGTMHDMASIDASFTDATDTSEDTRIDFSVYAAGVEVPAVFILPNTLSGANALHLEAPAGHMYFSVNGTDRWLISSSIMGAFVPLANNTYDFGAVTLQVKDAYLGTSIQGTRTQAITDAAAAATFVTVAAATSNTTVGGRIFYTITAIDAGTATQIKTGTYSFGLSNIGGTVTGAGTDVLEHSQLSTGTLAPTFSVNISGTNAQFQLVLDTSLDAGAEILKIEYRVQIDSGTATVTPAT